MFRKLTLALSVISFFISALVVSACSNIDKEEPEIEISVDSLPASAKEFLKKYYPESQPSKIEKENDGDIEVYVVSLDNGHEIVFNADGDWVQVDAPEGETIPAGIAPQAITQYLDENYSGYGIREINSTGYGYNVVLTTGLNLRFNELGQFLEVVSDN